MSKFDQYRLNIHYYFLFARFGFSSAWNDGVGCELSTCADAFLKLKRNNNIKSCRFLKTERQ